jgi:hypothetical protein
MKSFEMTEIIVLTAFGLGSMVVRAVAYVDMSCTER